ncbi:hypothetical protein Thermo_01961 [Thermoplasmatales archaeon]|nr:hypothetical protein Thermo_01961 [Thermoplasmatales archaeon]
MEDKNVEEYKHFVDVYDNTNGEDSPTFIDLIGIITGHVGNEENLVVPLLDYLKMEVDGLEPKRGAIRDIASEFSSQLEQMMKEHEEGKKAAHRLSELSKATKNKRAYNIWTSMENHFLLEESALKLAESAAKSILTKE